MELQAQFAPPRIKVLASKNLVGLKIVTSLSHNKTAELWSKFMPNKSIIPNTISSDLISMQTYDKDYFKSFNPSNEFEKWAMVEVSTFENISPEWEKFVLVEGLYAVFHYQGLGSDTRIFQYIYTTWLPQSDYVLDDRPHFEILGSKYKNNDPLSEEEIWIPIRVKG